MNKNKNVFTATAAGLVIGFTSALGVASLGDESKIDATDLSAIITSLEQTDDHGSQRTKEFYEQKLRERVEAMREKANAPEQEAENIVSRCFSDDPQEFRSCLMDEKEKRLLKVKEELEQKRIYRAAPQKMRTETELRFKTQIEDTDRNTFRDVDEEYDEEERDLRLERFGSNQGKDGTGNSFNIWNEREIQEKYKDHVREEAEYRLEVIKRCHKAFPEDFRNCFQENIDKPEPETETITREPTKPAHKPQAVRPRIKNTDLPLRELVKLCLKEDPTTLRECVKESLKNVYRPDDEFDHPDEIGTVPDGVEEGEAFKVRRDHSQESI